MKIAVTLSLCLFLSLHFFCNQVHEDTPGTSEDIDDFVKTEVSAKTTFIKHFGYSGNESIISILKTIDDGFVLSGKSDRDFYLVKTNCNGNLIWEKSFGDEDIDEHFGSVCQSYDDGYLVAGTDNTNSEVEVIKIDKKGSVQWQQNYPQLKSSTLVRIIPAFDSGFAGITGNTVFKLNASGNLLWGRQYDSCTCFHSIEPTTDHGFIVAGTALIKITSYGELQWKRSPDITKREVYSHALQTKDGGYVIVGCKIISYDEEAMVDIMKIVVQKTDSNGKHSWRKYYLPTYNYNFQYRIRETSDHQFAIVGFHDFKCTVMKIGPSGSFKWQKEVGWDIFDGEFYDLVTTPDGGIVVSGTGNGQAALVKFDRFGNF